MNNILVKPKSKEEEEFLTKLLKKLNIDSRIIEEPVPNSKTKKAIKEFEKGNGIKAENSKELFSQLDI